MYFYIQADKLKQPRYHTQTTGKISLSHENFLTMPRVMQRNVSDIVSELVFGTSFCKNSLIDGISGGITQQLNQLDDHIHMK